MILVYLGTTLKKCGKVHESVEKCGTVKRDELCEMHTRDPGLRSQRNKSKTHYSPVQDAFLTCEDITSHTRDSGNIQRLTDRAQVVDVEAKAAMTIVRKVASTKATCSSLVPQPMQAEHLPTHMLPQPSHHRLPSFQEEQPC